MPAGRPTSYKPEYVEQAQKLCMIGAIDKQLAVFFNVTVTTLNTWKREHPEFLASIKQSKELLDNQVVQSLYRRANGYKCNEDKVLSKDGIHTDTVRVTKEYPPDTVAAIFWLKNRQPKEWQDKRELGVSHSKDVSSLTDAELQDIIAARVCNNRLNSIDSTCETVIEPLKDKQGQDKG